MKRIYITDKEVACATEISTSTLSRIMGGFYRGSRHDKYSRCLDLRKAEPVVFGGYRRWEVVKLASILGITPEELIDRIS